jgi:hypothetical protein
MVVYPGELKRRRRGEMAADVDYAGQRLRGDAGAAADIPIRCDIRNAAYRNTVIKSHPRVRVGIKG